MHKRFTKKTLQTWIIETHLGMLQGKSLGFPTGLKWQRIITPGPRVVHIGPLEAIKRPRALEEPFKDLVKAL